MMHYAPLVALVTTLLAGMFAGWMLLSTFTINATITLIKLLRCDNKLSQMHDSSQRAAYA